MQKTNLKRADGPYSLGGSDRDFSVAMEELLAGRKAGHLGLFHYGEPDSEGDPVNGSYLWDRFVKHSPNYYQFRSENEIIPEVAGFVAGLTGSRPVSLVDLGPGSDASLHAKTFPFLSSIDRIEKYIPVDISAEYLREIDGAVSARYPYLDVSLQQRNYFTDAVSFNVNSVPVFLFLSSNISNLPEADRSGNHEKHLGRILSHFHGCMHRPGYLVVSQDSNQDEASLIGAYGDPLHVDFSLNVLHRIKRDALDEGCDTFDPESWIYQPEWFPERNLLAHSVYSAADQEISVLGRKYRVPRGSRLVLDNSHKYKVPDFLDVCTRSGFSPVKTFMDDSGRIAVHVLEALA
jgi:L-histidine N-alpha-methyltransferase